MKTARTYVICCVQRTGSWLLAHALADTGCAGRPADYFDEEDRRRRTEEWGLPEGDLAAFVGAVRSHATTPNGVLGSKLMWNTFEQLWSDPELATADDPGRAFMELAFPGARFVWLRREDKVRQGISWWRAVSSGEWAVPHDRHPTRPELDVAQIVPLVRFAQACEDGWRDWFASTGARPLEVVYEDLSRDRLGTVNRVLEFLDLPPLGPGDLPPTRYRRQADDWSEHHVTLVRDALRSSG